MKKLLCQAITMVLAMVFLFKLNIVCAPGEENSKQFPLYPKNKNTIRIMSYNVLADSMGFDGLNVNTREVLFKDTIYLTTPDILCLQEVSNNWYASLEKINSELQFTAPIRNKLSMCMTPILYNTQNLILLNSGIESYSSSFDSRLRCISWGYFLQKSTNKKFIVINTHLSLFGKKQYLPLLQATELLEFVDNIKAKLNCPVFVVGDFNSKQRSDNTSDSSTYEFISLSLSDSRFYAKSIVSHKDKGVFSPINDYIFFTGNVAIENYTLLSLPQLKTISDHYPIYADITV